MTVQKFKVWYRNRGFTRTEGFAFGQPVEQEYNLFKGELTPCTQIAVHKIWSKAFSKLNSESPVRKCNVNGDGVKDIVIGFGVDDNVEYGDDSTIPKCELDVGGYREFIYCQGGVLAIDGVTGETIWQRWTSFNIFSIFCDLDFNSDGQPDCVASGRGGVTLAFYIFPKMY